MSDAIWYYAQGDKEQGPVTLVQIKALIGAGKIKPDDLVWKDGMDDWLPAKSVPGLFSTPEAALPEPAASARPKSAAAAAPKIEASARPAEPKAPPSASAGPPPPVEAPPPESTAQRSTAVSAAISPARSASTPLPAGAIGRWAGWGLIIVGFVLALSARGCDGVGHRYAQRVQAHAAAAVNPPADMQAAARSAMADYQLWSMLRETVFVFASLLLVAGLFTRGLGSDGPEKWICLVMLAIVLFGLYTGGAGGFR